MKPTFTCWWFETDSFNGKTSQVFRDFTSWKEMQKFIRKTTYAVKGMGVIKNVPAHPANWTVQP